MTYLDMSRSIRSTPTHDHTNMEDTAEATLEARTSCEKSEMCEKTPTELDPGEIVWRVEAFRAHILAHGPIWVSCIRNDDRCDLAGHCSLCGDALPPDPSRHFPRCNACVQALTVALNTEEEWAEIEQWKEAGLCLHCGSARIETAQERYSQLVIVSGETITQERVTTRRTCLDCGNTYA